MRASLAILLLIAGCTTVKPWTVTGAPANSWPSWDADSRTIVAAVETVSGDKSGNLRAGGSIIVHAPPDWIPCNLAHTPDPTVSGCNAPGRIDILYFPIVGLGPAPKATALAHEACHLGLESGGGLSGPVVEATEAQADACAAKAISLLP